MKRILLIFLALLLLLSGCVKRNSPENAILMWEEQAGLNTEETPEELYKKALGEGTLIVYSTSTRMMDVAQSFEKQYPGLTVRVEDIREGEMYDMLENNFVSGTYDCDIICSADGRGILSNRFLPDGLVFKYTPYDIAEKLLPGVDEDTLMLAGEAILLFYNDEYYAQPPVNNWWELTEARWYGSVYMPNPFRSTTTLVFLSMFMQNSDLMSAAYEERYGEVLEIPEGETAGHVFIRRLMENNIIIVNSSDEVTEYIAEPGNPNGNLGILVSSKLRLRDIGYALAINRDLTPVGGLFSPIYLMMAGGSKNVSSAKLFIRWMFGEADGQCEGYKPYLQSGAWSMRSDVSDFSAVSLESLNLKTVDRKYLYENSEDILAFWEDLVMNKG